MINKQKETIEEFNNWCKENKITIGKDMKTESIMIGDWWIEKLQSQTQDIKKKGQEKIKEYVEEGDDAGADVLKDFLKDL